VAAGETCDPPGSVQSGGGVCRSDCTYCGDGTVQQADGETCDDGNTVSGCRPDQPQRPLDGCLNSCQRPICDDPSKIKLLADPALDLVQTHGRLVTPTEVHFESEDFTLKVTRRVCSHDGTVVCSADADCEALSPGSVCTQNSEGSLVFEQSLPAGAIPHPLPKSWKYKNPLAKTAGGIYALKIVSKLYAPTCAGGSNDSASCTDDGDCPAGTCLGYYKYSVKAYGQADRAVADLETQTTVGSETWAVRGLWTQQSTVWKLTKQSTFLDPWP
jgi:hypothetical protein